MEQFARRPALYFGPDALTALQEIPGERVMIVTDGFLAGSGLLDRVRAQLSGREIAVFDQVKPDPTLELVARGVTQFRAFQPQALIAFGGGSPMDCAKGIRYFAAQGGQSPCPLWCVPTTAGTGSEATSFAVLTDTQAGVKRPLVDNALLPETAVLDASLLDGVPPAVSADTGMDVLTHAAEAYVSAGASPFSDALAAAAFSLALGELLRACQGPGEARERMLQASCMAGMAFNAAGLGICHSLAHALGGRFHLPHGRLNALLLPHVIRFNAAHRGAAARYARLARLCGLAGNARALAAALERLGRTLGMPGSLTACGVSAPQLRAALPELAAAALADGCTRTNPRPAEAGDLEAILQAAL